MSKSLVDGPEEFAFDGSDFSLDLPSLKVSDPSSWIEVRDRINEIPQEYAYWSAIYAEIQQKLKDAELNYDTWFATQYDAVSKEMKASTSESAKKHKVVVENYDKYVELQQTINGINRLAMKVYPFIKSLDMQLRGLQTVGSALKAEMNMSATGSGSLSED